VAAVNAPIASTLTGNELGAYPVTVETMRSAGLVVCGRAQDREDARLLCEAIGLVPTMTAPPRPAASELCEGCGYRVSGRNHWNLCVRREPRQR
jgi:hypothetical protein